MTMDPKKLALVAAGVESLAERIDYMASQRMDAPLITRRADKTFDESKHPRGPDGKFVEGEGAAGASAAEYLAKQAKAGKKATPQGMMQHLLLNGGITKNEIWDTTKANFEMAPHLNNYVSAVLATMKKKGLDVAEPPKPKKGGDKPAAKKEEPKAEEKPAGDDPTEKQKKTQADTEDYIANLPHDAEKLNDAGKGVDYAVSTKQLTKAQGEALKAQIAAKVKQGAAPAAAGTDAQQALNKAWEESIAQMNDDGAYLQMEAKIVTDKNMGKITEAQAKKLLESLADKTNALIDIKEAAPAKDAGQLMAEALAKLPNPINLQEDDIAWMAKNQMFSATEKLKYINEMKVAPPSQPYKDQVMAALEIGAGKSTSSAAPVAIPPPKESSGVQKSLHGLAVSSALPAYKISKLKEHAANLTNAENKAYAAALLQSVESQAEGAAAAPPPPPPPKPPIAATAALQTELADLKGKWKGILPVNKAPVDVIEQALDKALGMGTAPEQAQALSQITPIPNPTGMGQQSANAFLAKAQKEAGITPTTPGHPSNAPATSSLPKGPGKKLQAEIFHALEDSPAVYIEQVAKFEGAAGKIKARNVIDTDRIPKDEYAKVTSAYGAERGNGMTQAVDKAMREYSHHSFDKLDDDTKAAVAAYQGNSYGAINGALLAGSEGSGATKQKIQRIRKAIENSVIPADTPAFRGMRCSLKDLSGFDDPAKSVGRAFVHKNFASISRSEAKARDFGEDVMLKMTIPAGTRGLVMGKQDWEREIMLQANSVFRIEKVEQKVSSSGKAQHLVHVIYMGTKEDA
jgi:hypothetical protein